MAGLVYAAAILAQPGQTAFEAMGGSRDGDFPDLLPDGVMTMPAEVAQPIFHNRRPWRGGRCA